MATIGIMPGQAAKGGGGGGGGTSIGGGVSGGTAGSVLFVGSGNDLQQDNAGFQYDPATNQLKLTAGASTDTPLVVKAASGQTANLQEWQTSAGVAEMGIRPGGRLVGTSSDTYLDLVYGSGAILQYSNNNSVKVGSGDVYLYAGGSGHYVAYFGGQGGLLAPGYAGWDTTLGTSSSPWHQLYLQNFISMKEQTAPANAPADSVYIYAEDNGSGKTRLMAKFATGAAVQIAIQP